MYSSSYQEDFTAVFAGFDTLMDRALTLDTEVLTTPECLAMLDTGKCFTAGFPPSDTP